MSDVCLIEVNDRAVGLVARERGERGYCFHAATAAAFPLDGSRFATPAHAQKAARKLLARPQGTAGRA